MSAPFKAVVLRICKNQDKWSVEQVIYESSSSDCDYEEIPCFTSEIIGTYAAKSYAVKKAKAIARTLPQCVVSYVDASGHVVRELFISGQVKTDFSVKEIWFSVVSEDTPEPLYKKVVYRIIRQAPDFWAVDWQTWVSKFKDISASVYDGGAVGVYPTKNQAQQALHRAAHGNPIYSVIVGGFKEGVSSIQVYERAVFKDGVLADVADDAAVWFAVEGMAGIGESEADGAGHATPPSNTGGLAKKEKEPTDYPFKEDGLPEEIAELNISETYQHQVMEHGVLKTVMLRRGINSPAFIDTLSFTVKESFFEFFNEDDERVTGDAAIAEAIHAVRVAMGLDVVKEVSGRNGYSYALQFGIKEDESRNYGFVAWGGDTQNGSIMFHFTGEGLAAAKDGWEKYLFHFLSGLREAGQITRVDISHDMLLGHYSIEQAVQDWQNDCYTVRQTKPQAECQGSDWLSNTKKGRTFYIGSKKSSRILYFYEKGKQLGDESSPWVRVELRQRNKDYIIPKDVLLYPGDFLCTAYPHLSKVLDYDFAEQYRFERIKKSNGIAVEHVVKYAKMQVSPAIKMLQSLGLDAEDIVEKLLNKKAHLPKRLVMFNPDQHRED